MCVCVCVCVCVEAHLFLESVIVIGIYEHFVLLQCMFHEMFVFNTATMP
jgi:hypothetical protein